MWGKTELRGDNQMFFNILGHIHIEHLRLRFYPRFLTIFLAALYQMRHTNVLTLRHGTVNKALMNESPHSSQSEKHTCI